MQPPVIPPPCVDFLGCELVSLGAGTATIRFRPRPEMANPYGQVQGGIVAGIVDNVVGPAAWSVMGGKTFVTVQMSLSYLRAIALDDVVLAHARVVHAGRTQVLVEARLEREVSPEDPAAERPLLCQATVTNVVVG